IGGEGIFGHVRLDRVDCPEYLIQIERHVGTTRATRGLNVRLERGADTFESVSVGFLDLGHWCRVPEKRRIRTGGNGRKPPSSLLSRCEYIRILPRAK